MESVLIPAINSSFINKKGEKFELIKKIAYKKGQLIGNLGKFVNETKRGYSDFFHAADSCAEGVYIYQTYRNPNVAYRIYKEFADNGFNGYQDDKLIERLLERKNRITLAQFPTGVITLDGKIIGQEIPYFPEAMTIYDYSKSTEDKNPIKIYTQIVNILKELYDNGILYLDNHGRNFMINKDRKIEIIDFEDGQVKIDDYCKDYKRRLFTNYQIMIQTLNTNFGINEQVGDVLLTDCFEELYEQIDDMSKKLIK